MGPACFPIMDDMRQKDFTRENYYRSAARVSDRLLPGYRSLQCVWQRKRFHDEMVRS